MPQLRREDFAYRSGAFSGEVDTGSTQENATSKAKRN
jgi:hypothetical protein